MYHGIDAKADRSWCCLFEWLCCFVMTNCHRVLSRVSVGICAALFIAACTSDPGTVTAGNVAAHNKLYPCNDRLWCVQTCLCKHAQFLVSEEEDRELVHVIRSNKRKPRKGLTQNPKT
eukprot:scaffold101631_cov17-Tisochrysis_lutea.AAC.3